MPHYHAVVWMDHQKATAWHFTPTAQEKPMCMPMISISGSTAARAPMGVTGPPPTIIFSTMLSGDAGAHEILLIGPRRHKQQFAAYLRDKKPQLGKSIVAVETADHPSDAQF